MTSEEIRQSFLRFFKERGHSIIPSASLIPENDPTALFTIAGVHPLIPFILGEKHPAGRRLANIQKCIRTSDIEEVGDYRHSTFLEMLGNWSLGDYFKKETVEWSWEFLTDEKWLGLKPERIYITVFKGDKNAPQDQEVINEWQRQFNKAGIKTEICPYNEPIATNKNYRIFPLSAEDNWWGPIGLTGPCGPTTEIFYDLSPEDGPMRRTFDEEVEAGRIVEIWNDVFMEFNKTAGGKFEKLSQYNVDTGMGFERLVMALNGQKNIFDTELFYPIFKKIEELSGKKYNGSGDLMRAMRIIADHIKASVFILSEGIEPSNTERGYVLRRLIRRAVRYGKQLGINEDFTFKAAQPVIEMYKNVYPEVLQNSGFIEKHLTEEEEKFGKTLEKGLKQFEKLKSINGKQAFNLYQTYGFPIEMTKELAKEKGISVNESEFESELKKHRELSKTASVGKFKGGLADFGEQTKKLHTAAHLLLAALRQVLGEHVAQKGSNITAERLRFDFSHPEKLTDEQKQQVEDLVNEAIKKNLPVDCDEMSLDEAKKKGAMGVFESKYGERVKVYTIKIPSTGSGQVFSKEICGGPHVKSTGELGHFKIVKQEASSAGVRRIKAVLG